MNSPAQYRVEVDAVAAGHRLRLFANGIALRQGDYLSALAADGAFAGWYSQQLCRLGGPAFFWEHPPMSLATVERPVELVILDAPALEAVRADPRPFAEHFAPADQSVCVFPSLGGDAQLIAPCPAPGGADYAHLAAFLRTGSAQQIHALWGATARAAQAALARQAATWLSTSGLGVYWLHVRIDQRPKYYQHDAYR